MEDEVVTVEFEGLIAKIIRDENPSRPDEWGDDSLILVHYHKEFWIESPRISEGAVRRHFSGEESLADEYWIYPTYAYIHSGVVLSLDNASYPFNDTFDVSQAGFIFVSRKEWADKDDARLTAESYVKTWNMYLGGEVFGFVVADSTGRRVDDGVGLYGLQAAKEEALLRLQYIAQQFPRRNFLFQYRREQRAEFSVRAHFPKEAQVLAKKKLGTVDLRSKDDVSDDEGALKLLEVKPDCPAIQRVLDLSTAHICADAGFDPSFGPLPPKINWGGLRVSEHEHGWTVFVSSEPADAEPEWIGPAMELARKHDCIMINFDEAGETLDELPKWEW